MTNKEWNNYVDTGYVPQRFIKEIVTLIKNGMTLNMRHIQVYMTHSSIIELYLKNEIKNK
jgi:N12 class adenine-specific DNA methylase